MSNEPGPELDDSSVVPDEVQAVIDLRFLASATRELNGYFVQRWFSGYLGLLFDNLGRYLEMGLQSDLARPTDAARYSMLFDFTAIDAERLAYVNGMYFYIYASHKVANHDLMRVEDRKHVLYLRGYDYELSVAQAGAAVGMYSMDTERFTLQLSDLLDPATHDLQAFKILSSLDLWTETIDAQNAFYGGYDEVVTFAHRRIRGIYLNASSWKDDIGLLLDRMDHYVVYVSSITESALWEVDQLDRDDRRDRVTIVFDREAIANKELQLGIRDAMRQKYVEHVIWFKPGSSPAESADDLYAHLAERFQVTTPERFSDEIDSHRERISRSNALLAPGGRETWIDFRFRPGVSDAELAPLRQFAELLESEITDWLARGIDALPIFLNLVQLQIFTTLLLGRHDDTGVALTRYTAVMEGTHDYYAAPGDKPGDLSAEGRERSLSTLEQHGDLARSIAWFLLSVGQSHEFGDHRARASAVYDAELARTRTAVDRFYQTALELNRG